MLFPTGSLGLKYLEKDFIIKKEYKNIKNILVLSGADERIIASISLAYQYPEAKVFYVGGNAYLVKNNDNDDPTIAKKFYNELNFDMDRINFIGKSRNTIENFKEIKELNLKYSETILITSAYHMKRSYDCRKARKAGTLSCQSHQDQKHLCSIDFRFLM